MKHRTSAAPTASSGLIASEDLRPVAELAGCWSWPGPGESWWQYHLIRPHWLLVESGHLMGRTPFGSFEAKAPSLICFRPTVRNLYGMRAGTRSFQLITRFAPPPNTHLVPSLDGIGPIPLHLPLGDAFERTRRLFETICMELPRTPASRQLRVRSAIFELLAIIEELTAANIRSRGRAGSADAKSRGATTRAGPLDVFQRARNRLESQLRETIRVSDLAGEAGMSVEHFIRRFRHRFGISPSACRTRAKLVEAARLLRAGDRSVKSVAYSLGFQDPDAFARLFKRHIGLAPSRCLPRAAEEFAGLTSTVAELMPEEPMEGRFYQLNAHITPSDNDHPRAFDELTDWVAHTNQPRSAEDYIYLRKARGAMRK